MRSKRVDCAHVEGWGKEGGSYDGQYRRSYFQFRQGRYSKQTIFESVNKLEQSVEFNARDIADLKRDQLELKFENENLKKQLLYSESYSRRENLRFNGIVENSSDSTDNRQNAAKSSDSLHSENTKDVLFKFLEDELNITDARKRIEFQRVHRLGKPRSSGNPRRIIARFLCYQDREEVRKKHERN